MFITIIHFNQNAIGWQTTSLLFLVQYFKCVSLKHIGVKLLSVQGVMATQEKEKGVKWSQNMGERDGRITQI